MTVIRRYFPSGKIRDFSTMTRVEVADMIGEFVGRTQKHTTDNAFYEFIENPPEIDWMLDVASKLSAIDMGGVYGDIGMGLRSEKGAMLALRIAQELKKA